MNVKKVFKIFLKILFAIIILLVTGTGIFFWKFGNAMGLYDQTYSVKDLIDNFNLKKNEIYQVKNYINEIKPKYKNVELEFKSDDEIDRLDIMPVDTGKGSDLTGFTDWNLKVGSHKLDSLLIILGWDNNKLMTLKQKLDAAGCISARSGEPSKIGFQRSGMGEYFFNVFDKPMTEGVKKQYQDTCLYRYVNNKLILEYGGGAIGPQCFPRQ